MYHPAQNPTPSSPPVSGWKYSDDGWKDDDKLTVESKGVRLVGGSSSREGNVFIGGQPVCDDYWDDDDELDELDDI